MKPVIKLTGDSNGDARPAIQEHSEITGHGTGFLVPDTSFLSADDATRTLTISPTGESFDTYDRNTVVTINGPRSIVVPDQDATAYVIFPKTGTPDGLHNAGAQPGYDQRLVFLYGWDADGQKFWYVGDERHGTNRTDENHRWRHETFGVQWLSGGTLTYTADDPGAIGITVNGPVRLADEDLVRMITHSDTPSTPYQQKLTDLECPVLYRKPNGNPTSTGLENTYPMGTLAVAYNPSSGGLADVPDGKFVNYALVYSMDFRTPVKVVAGREVYDTLDSARGERFIQSDLPHSEMRFSHVITVEVDYNVTENPYKIAGIREVRAAENPVGSIPVPSSASHDTLGDREIAGQHPTSAIYDVERGNQPLNQTLNQKVEDNDSRLSNSREWTAETVDQAEAQEGSATTRRAWTAERVWQAITGFLSGTGTKTINGLISGTAVTQSATDTTAGRLLKVGDSPTILLFDPLRRAVESESGGKQTVIYTAKKQPCIMNVIPRFLMEDLPGWDIADGTGTHPAFLFNGVVASEIFIAAYQASEVAGEAISQPMAYPRHTINYDQARALCQANGAGWDMMSNWDWAAVALWCMANGFQPRGNTQFGRHHDSRHETGRVPAGATIGSDATGVTNTLTGSGPNTWRHDNSTSGISDLVGNVWEWQTGFKLVDGVALIAPDNGTYTEAQHTNTGYTMPAAGGAAFSGFVTTAPAVLKQAMVMPKAANNPIGGLWTELTGERLPFRGGARDAGGFAGLGALILDNVRTGVSSSLGFRPRFRNL